MIAISQDVARSEKPPEQNFRLTWETLSNTKISVVRSLPELIAFMVISPKQISGKIQHRR